MNRLLQEIVALTMGATTRPVDTGIPRVVMVKGDVPEYQLSALYEPMIGFIVQGTKILSIGSRDLHLKGPSYFLLPMHVPAAGKVRANREGLYLSVGLFLNRDVLQNLLRDLPLEAVTEPANNLAACDADVEFMEAWVRMLRLLRTPKDIPALAPVYEREIIYRVLVGPQGGQLRQLCFRESNLSRVSKGVQWLREHYRQPIEIKDIARKAGMGITTFHRQFKRTTGLSPIQFQKQLRLLEARKLIAFDGYGVSGAAYEVGYESPSQFNREYSRLFGASPARDAAMLRQMEDARESSSSRA